MEFKRNQLLNLAFVMVTVYPPAYWVYNNNNNTYIALIRMRSKRFTSIVLQYDLEIYKQKIKLSNLD